MKSVTGWGDGWGPIHSVSWCNGSTADFDSADPGSTPGGTNAKVIPKGMTFLRL